MKRTTLLLGLVCCLPCLAADDQIILNETVISGNQELPRVLFVQPWQEVRSDVPVIAPASTVNRFLQHVYPHTYQRMLRSERQQQHEPSTEN